ncbi:glycoside hydrolase family protein [Poriferisphaera corsica]|nr:hypothetical protein [Poriferisphaera corsica]
MSRFTKLFVTGCAGLLSLSLCSGLLAVDEGVEKQKPMTSEFIGVNDHAIRFKPKLNAPLIKDFMGINGHTFQMNASIYSPLVKNARDFHGINWDLADDSSRKTTFPIAANGTDWNIIYGSWLGSGMTVDVSLMIHRFTEKDWKNVEVDAPAYAKAFAEFFGPTKGNGLVSSIEIGNETKTYNDEFYLKVFKLMAKAIRDADPAIRILPASVQYRESSKYHRNVEVLRNDIDLFDVLNVHTYPFLKKWPSYEMTYPEHQEIEYLKSVKGIIEWRDKYAKDKEIWITEFGWDSSTQKPNPNGNWKDWVCVTDRQQAQYIARSYLIFAGMKVDRAYLFWFDDNDVPQLFGSSGVTRMGKPKESYWSMEQIQRLLGEYRFDRKIKETENVYAYAYVNGSDANEEIWAIWSPTGEDRVAEVVLNGFEGQVEWVKPMAVGRTGDWHGDVVYDDHISDKPNGGCKVVNRSQLKVTISESPIYVKINK